MKKLFLLLTVMFVSCVQDVVEYVDIGYVMSKDSSTNVMGYEDGVMTNFIFTITLSNTYNTNIKTFLCRDEVIWTVLVPGKDTIKFEKGDWNGYKYTNRLY